MTGRATDNAVGSDMIKEQLNVPAFNALTQETGLGSVVMEKVFGQ